MDKALYDMAINSCRDAIDKYCEIGHNAKEGVPDARRAYDWLLKDHGFDRTWYLLSIGYAMKWVKTHDTVFAEMSRNEYCNISDDYRLGNPVDRSPWLKEVNEVSTMRQKCDPLMPITYCGIVRKSNP